MIRKVVVAFSLLALAQPAMARSHHPKKHSHHHRHHHVRVAPDAARSSESFGNPQYDRAGFPTMAPSPRPVRSAFSGELDSMIARHAAANGVPESLVRRVVMRESRGNPRASNRGALGLMQIKHATARGMGYNGPASGLFDAETNLTYAVRYLAGAYRAAGGNADRAVSFYARGYYHQAKRQGLSVNAAAAPNQAYASADPSTVYVTASAPSRVKRASRRAASTADASVPARRASRSAQGYQPAAMARPDISGR